VAWVLASNALQALMLVERERPDLLILSSRLEPVDGFALVEHLRRHATFRQVPAVVLLSDDELEGQQVRAHRPPGAMVWRALFPLARIQGLIDGQRAAAWREQR
jgi:CheY-like chemotaxis protein